MNVTIWLSTTPSYWLGLACSTGNYAPANLDKPWYVICSRTIEDATYLTISRTTQGYAGVPHIAIWEAQPLRYRKQAGAQGTRFTFNHWPTD